MTQCTLVVPYEWLSKYIIPYVMMQATSKNLKDFVNTYKLLQNFRQFTFYHNSLFDSIFILLFKPLLNLLISVD